jgi:hypothetical protein
MWNVKSEIINNAQNLNVEIRIVDDSEAKKIRQSVEMKFCKANRGERLFERLISCNSIRGSDVWTLVEELTGEDTIYVFPEETEDKSVYVFNNGKDLLKVHAECANFTIYVCNLNIDYLIVSTVENTLVVSGTIEDSELLNDS